MGYNIFVAISTGEQVANLPPILALAKKHDRVLWLESQWAREKQWAQGAIDVLNERGLKQETALIDGDMDEPISVADSLNAVLPGMVGNACDSICMILNGGKKLTPIGLVLAVQEARGTLPEHCEIKFLYGDHQPAQLKIHSGDILANQEIITYNPAKMLKITELFQLKGLSISWDKKWVWGNQVADERYGMDADLTRLVHDCYARGFDGNQGDPISTTDWPAYQKWTEPSQIRWQEAISKQLKYYNIVVHNGDLDSLSGSISASVRKFFPKTMQRELSTEEHANLAKDGWINQDNSMQLGFRFELAVWHRTVRFLYEHPEYKVLVKECVLGIRVERDRKQESELDVVLVLTNGIPIHLECKTWAFAKKDADARIQVLQQASSRLAIMYAVAPMFPSMDGEEWFGAMHQRFQGLIATIGKEKVIAFTMPKPPATYNVQTQKKTESFHSPDAFETSLKKILNRFLPKKEG